MTHRDESAVARRRKVAASLRHLRGEAGRTEDEAAAHLDCSLPRLRRIEAGMAAVRVAEVAARPGVTLQVLPFEAGPHHALGAGFHIFEFAGDEPGVVELELLDRVAFVVEPGEVGHYAEAFEQVRRQALDAARSRALLSYLDMTA